MRVNLTERKGVIEVDRIFTSELEWIFREQPVLDVGIDALIEETINGNPTGRFLAAQIKTGEGNFNINAKELTLYVSKIHYHYWLNLSIPIILIAHLPKTGITFWQHITESNFFKTKKNWKLKIPKTNTLNKKAKSSISTILQDKSKSTGSIVGLYWGNIEPDSLYDLPEKMDCIAESANSIKIIGEVLGKLKQDVDNMNIRFKEFNKSNISAFDQRYKAVLKSLARQLNIASNRIEKETELYSELFSEGFTAYEIALIVLHQIDKKNKDVLSSVPILESVSAQINSAIIEFDGMKNKTSRLPRNFKILREARDRFVLTIESLLVEFETSKNMISNILNEIKKNAR